MFQSNRIILKFNLSRIHLMNTACVLLYQTERLWDRHEYVIIHVIPWNQWDHAFIKPHRLNSFIPCSLYFLCGKLTISCILVSLHLFRSKLVISFYVWFKVSKTSYDLVKNCNNSIANARDILQFCSHRYSSWNRVNHMGLFLAQRHFLRKHSSTL